MVKIKKHKEKSRLIICQGDSILLLQKHGAKLKYTIVGGGLEKGENPEEAVIRETQEEIGVTFTLSELEYTCSVTSEIRSKNVYKHYFLSQAVTKPFVLSEPEKFKKLEWVHWERSLKYLDKSDKKVVKQLFTPCRVNF